LDSKTTGRLKALRGALITINPISIVSTHQYIRKNNYAGFANSHQTVGQEPKNSRSCFGAANIPDRYPILFPPAFYEFNKQCVIDQHGDDLQECA